MRTKTQYNVLVNGVKETQKLVCMSETECVCVYLWRLQINIYQCFVLQFSQILVLTFFPGFFSAAILDRRYKPKTLVCNPIQSNALKKKHINLNKIGKK